MLSKAKIKFVKSLQIKKYRKQEQCFVVEGAKSVGEVLKSDFDVTMLFATPDFLNGMDILPSIEVTAVTAKALEEMGTFQSNDSALAIARIKPNKPLEISSNEFVLVLDDIRDPGNLGTIIRTADWYGISKVIASEETADVYSQKVVTSTMGSFTRVKIYYTNLATYLKKQDAKVFGAYLDGKDIHQASFGSAGFILIGNESKGISPELESFITDKVTIPRYGEAESLNAAIATAIICDNLRR